MNPWENESGFLTDLAKYAVDNRDTIPDDILISAWRELDAVTRLLWVAIFCKTRPKGMMRVAAACGINYGQTPLAQHGYFPPAELSMKLHCFILEDKVSPTKTAGAAAAGLPEIDLADFD